MRKRGTVKPIDRRSLIAAAGVLAGAGLIGSSPARARAYPQRPVKLIVPYPAGGGTDVLARLLAQKIEGEFSQPIVIDNRAGGASLIGTRAVSDSPADGYTIGVVDSAFVTNPSLFKDNIPYDTRKDFTPVSLLTRTQLVLSVLSSSKFNTAQELVAYGKANELSLATGNASGVVMSETLARQVGWQKLLRVPFKSNPQAMTEVIAGRVQSMFTDIAAASAQLKAGTLRPIVVTSKQRSALMPDLPTIAETAVADYDLSGWIGLFAPAGTPRPIVEKLNAEVTKALSAPDVRQKLLDLGAEPSPMAVNDYAAWVQQEVNKWTKLVKEAGIQPE